MTVNETWKRFEREVASWFGTQRTPLSGGNSKHTHSDSLHDNLYVECKYRKRVAVQGLFDDTAAFAEQEGKIPVVALKQKGSPSFLLVVRPQDVTTIANYIRSEE